MEQREELGGEQACLPSGPYNQGEVCNPSLQTLQNYLSECASLGTRPSLMPSETLTTHSA